MVSSGAAMVMDRTQEHSASTSRNSSCEHILSQILGEIDAITIVLDAVVDVPKERQALKAHLLEFRDQTSLFQRNSRRHHAGSDSLPSSLEISISSLQRNVDLVARSLGIDPVWNSSGGKSRESEEGDESTSNRSVSGSHNWSHFKHRVKKLFRVPVGCKSVRAFSLRLTILGTSPFKH